MAALAWVAAVVCLCEGAPAPIRAVAPEPLRVTNVDPPTPVAGREVWLVVYGQGFSEEGGKVKVLVGKLEAGEVRVQSPKRLQAKLPASVEVGAAPVKVINPDGKSATLHNAVYFRPAEGGFDTTAMLFNMRYSGRGFLEWFKLGGAVMYVLAAISFFGVAWAIHCLLVLRRSQVLPRKFMDALSSQLAQGDTRAAAATCQRTGCAFARVILSGLQKISEPAEKVREAIGAAGSRESAHLHQKISYLANIGTISPMLGLLGTVFGMIMAFNIISSGDVRHYQLAAAIAKAMVTTAAGLVIGIPAMAVYFYLRGRLLRLITHMEVVADQVAQNIIERGEEE
jgi:biopolymer transport protein ExbB